MLRAVRRSVASLLGLVLLAGCRGSDRPPGEIVGARLPDAVLAQERAAQQAARREIDRRAGGLHPVDGKRILFGDLHVHTTYSIDAFLMSLPLFAGEGVHPPADACDFARYCAELDFFSLNDHAEALTPAHWRRPRRRCASATRAPAIRAIPIWSPSSAASGRRSGQTPETHYGHKNVIFPGLAEDELPARPITALARRRHDAIFRRSTASRARASTRGHARARRLRDFLGGWSTRSPRFRDCELGVDTRQLPADCRENAATPQRAVREARAVGLRRRS